MPFLHSLRLAPVSPRLQQANSWWNRTEGGKTTLDSCKINGQWYNWIHWENYTNLMAYNRISWEFNRIPWDLMGFIENWIGIEWNMKKLENESTWNDLGFSENRISPFALIIISSPFKWQFKGIPPFSGAHTHNGHMRPWVWRLTNGDPKKWRPSR